MLDAALLLLAIAGLTIASYFTAVAFHWMRPDARWVPRFCRMDERSCAVIVFTREARLLGPPNSLLGQFFYAALLFALVGGILDRSPTLWLALAASAGSVALSLYLAYALLAVLRVPCPLCFTSHLINLAILLLLASRL